MKNKLWKELIVAVLLISTILSFSTVAYGEITSVQQSMDTVKMEMKQAASAYVEPALKAELVPSSALYPLLNSVKKNYEATKKLILASNLSETEKQAKLKELEALYEEKITKGLIPYIDAYNYATKYLEPLLKEIKDAEAKNDFAAVEKAYHKLSVQLKSRTSILYRFTGKAARDLLLERYKKPADLKRDELIIPVTIIMKATQAQQLFQAGKVEEAKQLIEEIQALAAKLSSTHPFHLTLMKELERVQAIIFPTPPVTPPSTGGGSSETSTQRALRLAKADAIAKLEVYKEDNYSPINWASIGKHKADGLLAIKAAKTITEVTDALNAAQAKIDQVPIQSNVSTISGITVKGEAAEVDTTDSTLRTYKVILPTGTDLITLTNDDIKATTDANAKVGDVTSPDNGATWKVVVTPEDGKNTTTYTINVMVNTAPTVANPIAIQDGKVGNAVVVDLSKVFTDAEGHNLTITADEGEITGSTWSYTPVDADVGTTITVTLTADDGKHGTVVHQFLVSIMVVSLTLDSFGIAGHEEITGLTPGGTYAVKVDGKTYAVLSGGSLSEAGEAQPLSGTTITGLDNSKSYKVYDSRLVSVTPEVIKAGTLAPGWPPGWVQGDDQGDVKDLFLIGIQYQNDSQRSHTEIPFTGDFKGTFWFEISYIFTGGSGSIKLSIIGEVVYETGIATMTIPGSMFESGRDFTIHFITTP